MLGILRGHDEKGAGEGMRDAVDCDMHFLHGLEQRALGFWRGAIDLIDQDDLGKEGAGMEDKPLIIAVENGIADDVRRKQVAGELNAAEIEPEGTSYGMGEGGLADPGEILDEQVAAGHQAGNGEPDGFLLPEDDFTDLRYERLNPAFHGS